MILFIGILTATAAFSLFSYAAYLVYMRDERRQVGRRMQHFTATAHLEEPRDRLFFYFRGVRQLIRFIAERIKRLPRADYFERKLLRSGLPLFGSEFLAMLLVGSGAAFVLGWIFFASAASAAGCAALTALAGILYLEYRIRARREIFHRQLGDVLLMMANALRSGFSFLQAVELVAQDMKPPVSVEFGRLLHEARLGVATETALHNLSERVGSEDLDLIITAVLIQRQVGGNLAQIFDTISNTINDRLRLRLEIKTITAQGRASGLVLGLMPFGMGVLMYLLNPSYIEVLLDTDLGKIAIGVGLILEILGILAIRKIVDIKT